jgi:hypothetical protein
MLLPAKKKGYKAFFSMGGGIVLESFLMNTNRM